MEKIQMVYTLGIIAVAAAIGLLITFLAELVAEDDEEALYYSRMGLLGVIVFCFLLLILTGTL